MNKTSGIMRHGNFTALISMLSLVILAQLAWGNSTASDERIEAPKCHIIDIDALRSLRNANRLNMECLIVNIKHKNTGKNYILDLSGERFFPPICGDAKFCYDDKEMKEKLFADRDTRVLQKYRDGTQDVLKNIAMKINGNNNVLIVRKGGKIEDYCHGGARVTVGRIFSSSEQLDMYLNEIEENRLRYLRDGICDVSNVILVRQINLGFANGQ